MNGRGQQLAVTLTCLVAATTYAGAVTVSGLALFVLPAVLGAAVIAWSPAARRMPAATLIVGGLLVLGWSELVNLWSGTSYGPAARSTFVAAGCALVAAVASSSRWPALFLLAVVGTVAGALVLGAGSEVRIVAVAATVVASLTLGSIERSRRRWVAEPGLGLGLVLISIVVGGAAAAAVLLQTQRDPRQPEVLGPGLSYPRIKPPWKDPLGSPQTRVAAQQLPRPTTDRQKRVGRKQTAKHVSQPAASADRKQRSKTWLYVLASLVLVLVAVALLLGGRLLAVRLAWRRIRRRLASGAPPARVTGAWAWARLRLQACRLPLAVDVSPDAVAAGRLGDTLPRDVFGPLCALAVTTTAAAFGPARSMTNREADAAWTAAGQAEASARALLTRRGRVALALRGPDRMARIR